MSPSLNEGFWTDHAELQTGFNLLNPPRPMPLHFYTVRSDSSITVSVPRGHDRWWRPGAVTLETTATETRRWTPRPVETDRWSVGGEAGVGATFHDLGWGFTSRAKRRSVFPGPKSFHNLYFWLSLHVCYVVNITSKCDS